MIDDNVSLGMLLVYTTRAPGKALSADGIVVWREDATDLAATA